MEGSQSCYNTAQAPAKLRFWGRNRFKKSERKEEECVCKFMFVGRPELKVNRLQPLINSVIATGAEGE